MLFADFLEFPKGCYSFITKDTALDFRKLRRAPFAKLIKHGLRPVAVLSDADIRRCEHAAGIARVLPPIDKKLLHLR